jgi:hypothetical protein
MNNFLFQNALFLDFHWSSLMWDNWASCRKNSTGCSTVVLEGKVQTVVWYNEKWHHVGGCVPTLLDYSVHVSSSSSVHWTYSRSICAVLICVVHRSWFRRRPVLPIFFSSIRFWQSTVDVRASLNTFVSVSVWYCTVSSSLHLQLSRIAVWRCYNRACKYIFTAPIISL